jgi:hypothetical protein
MRAVNATNLKSWIARMAWMVNAVCSLFLAVLGTMMVWNVFGYEAQLAPLMLRTGVAFAITGMALALLSLRRVSLVSASR